MKVLLLAALVVVAMSYPFNHSEEETEWQLFKTEYEKEYKSEAEEYIRKKTFLQNLKFVHEHNAKYHRGEETFEVEINKFADLTAEEFKEAFNGLKVPTGHKRTGCSFDESEDADIPKSVDWRKEGAVTPVKDQGNCGSCWAFSSTGALEGQTFIIKKKFVSLSEQNLIDCSTPQGNQGCNGGLMDYAFEYIKENNGIDTEESYPYEGKDDTCRYSAANKGATDMNYVNLPKGNEKKLAVAVAKVGPISVGMDASHKSFHLYKKGIYKEPACSPKNIDHAVLAIGYGSDKKGRDYWLVKNSWGTDWGMKGYFLIARNDNNMCGISSLSSYPAVCNCSSTDF